PLHFIAKIGGTGGPKRYVPFFGPRFPRGRWCLGGRPETGHAKGNNRSWVLLAKDVVGFPGSAPEQQHFASASCCCSRRRPGSMPSGTRSFLGEAPQMTKSVAMPAVYLLLAAVPLHADVNENTAAKAVERLGGKLTLDNKDAARPIVGVDLSFTDLTDAGLKDFTTLKRLQTLNLGGTKITDVGLKGLGPLKRLETLHRGGT